jgi:hypothetical protein
VTWRRPKPLTLDAYFFGGLPESNGNKSGNGVDQDSSLADRFITALMWVSLVILGLLALCAAVVAQALYL